MIAKRFRLSESQVKKVLKKRKPFFSYGLTANVLPSSGTHARIGIILSAAQTKGSVNRNALRRAIYDLSLPFVEGSPVDIVYMFKKKVLLNAKDPLTQKELARDIPFLMRKIRQEYTRKEYPNNPPLITKKPL